MLEKIQVTVQMTSEGLGVGIKAQAIESGLVLSPNYVVTLDLGHIP